VEAIPMLDYNEIKIRLNELLAILIEQQGRKTEHFHLT